MTLLSLIVAIAATETSTLNAEPPHSPPPPPSPASLRNSALALGPTAEHAPAAKLTWALPQEPSAVHVDEGGYFWEVGTGLVTLSESGGPGEEIDFDEGIGLFLGFGRRFDADHDGLGYDLMIEGLYTDYDSDSTDILVAVRDVTTIGAMVSGLADYAVTERASVFGGLGVGLSWIDAGTQSDALNDFSDDEGALLTWQARAGARYRFTDSLSAHVGYRFISIDDADFDDNLGDASFALETEQHLLEVGLRFGSAGN